MRSITVSLLSAIAQILLVCAPVLAQFGGSGLPSKIQSYAPTVKQEQFALPRFDQSSVQVVPEYLNQPLLKLEQRRAVLAKLDQRLTCQFGEAPLVEVVRKLEDQLGIGIQINKRTLEDVGLATDVPVTLSLSQVRLRTALDLMLRELDLVYRIDLNRIEITTPEDAESELTTIFYPCSDLIYYPGGGSPDFDSLIQLLATVVDPESWEYLGGPGSMQPLSDGLVISQTDKVLFKVRQLLAALRHAKALSNENYDPTPIEMGVLQIEREQLQRQLAVQFSDLQFNNTPLHQVIDLMQQRTKVQFIIAKHALADVGWTPDVQVSGNWKLASAATVLKDVCSELELTLVQFDDVLCVTTPEEAESELVLNVYPIRDVLGSHGSRGANTYLGGGTDSFGGLIEKVTSMIKPESWEAQGGPGAIQPFLPSGVLVVSTLGEVQQKVGELLRDVRTQRNLTTSNTNAPASTPQASAPQFANGRMLPVTTELVDQTYRVQGLVNAHQLSEIAQSLRERVSPGSWDGQTAYIRTLGSNQLVVRNSAPVQQSIRAELRRSSEAFSRNTTPQSTTIRPSATQPSTLDPFASDSPSGGDDPFGDIKGEPFR